MSLPELARWGLAGLFTAVLAWAALSDVRERKIPNRAVLALLILAVLWMLVHPLWWDLWALAAGLLAFAVTFGLYSAGVIGAGDSKLFSAAALFAGIGDLGWLALGTALAGGVVAILGLILRPTRTLVLFQMRGRGSPGVPYGVAIAIAGAAMIWIGVLNLPWPPRPAAA